MRGIGGVSLLLVLAIAACSKPAINSDATVAIQAPSATPAAAKGTAAPPPVGPQLPLLAYSYADRIEAPAAAVPALLTRHQSACQSAGPALCQVVEAASRSDGADGAQGKLKLRADPAWLARFRANLAQDVKPAGGRVVGSTVATEDLTRAIVDTDAALRAKQALETRLEQLLANRAGPLSDLLEVEQQLARVQGEIDAARSELAVMRTRVATSDLTLSYAARTPLASSGAWRPVAEAARGAVGLFAQSLAVIVMLAAAALPFLLLVALLVVVLRLRRRRAVDRRPLPTADVKPSSED